MWKRRELVRDSAHEAPHGGELVRIKLALSVHSIAETDIIIQFILDDCLMGTLLIYPVHDVSYLFIYLES